MTTGEPIHYYYRWCSLARGEHRDGPGFVTKRDAAVTCPECRIWLANARALVRKCGGER